MEISAMDVDNVEGRRGNMSCFIDLAADFSGNLLWFNVSSDSLWFWVKIF
jgi:hypothetical protein